MRTERDMKTALCAAVAAAAVLCGCAERDFTLAERGKAGTCAIVLPNDASPSQKYAAQELQRYVKASTGVELPITAEPGKGGAVRFVTDESLGPDAYRLTVGGDAQGDRGRHVQEHQGGRRRRPPQRLPRHARSEPGHPRHPLRELSGRG